MNFSSLKNLSSMYLYMISVVCFVLANIIKDNSMVFYYILLVLGVGFFVFGLTKRIQKQ
jgi:hypothetical protein